MAVFFLLCANIVYILYMLIMCLLYGLCVPWVIVAFYKTRGKRLDDAMRFNNLLFGHYITRISWPLLRVRRLGLEHLPGRGPCIIVVNHRSFVDIFLCGLIPLPQIIVIVRSWPFRLWPLGWFMRQARYVDIEKTPKERLLGDWGRELVGRGCSFLFFPEGHRSRDGRLQRFRSGAFMMAAGHNLPLVPLCLSGSEQVTRGGGRLLHSARITLEFLPAIHPAAFPEEDRAQILRREVEKVFRNYFKE